MPEILAGPWDQKRGWSKNVTIFDKRVIPVEREILLYFFPHIVAQACEFCVVYFFHQCYYFASTVNKTVTRPTHCGAVVLPVYARRNRIHRLAHINDDLYSHIERIQTKNE